MSCRIVMVDGQWGFATGDELSGFSLWGYPTKQAAREAMQEYQ
jgi:hypothetical protein